MHVFECPVHDQYRGKKKNIEQVCAFKTTSFWLFLSCTVHQTETSRPPAVIRWRRSRRKPGRWLPRHCNRGLAPTALPSTVWPEGSQWGGARADWRLPQDTLPRYGESTQIYYSQTCRHTNGYMYMTFKLNTNFIHKFILIVAVPHYIFFFVVVSDFPQERCPVVLAPLLYPEKRDILMDRILPDSGELAKTMMESSLAEFMQEVGYGFCAR